MPWVRFTHDCEALATQERVIKPLWKVFYAHRNRVRVLRVKAGWCFWPLLPLEIAKWFLNVRFYEKRRPYLRLTMAALRDVAKGRYDRRHEEVLELARHD